MTLYLILIKVQKTSAVFSEIMRHAILQLLAVLLTAAPFLLHGQDAVPPRQAWTDGFWQQLPDDEEEAKPVTVQLQPSPSTMPPPAILPCPHRYFLYLAVFSWEAVAAILFVTAICVLFRFRAWYQEPSRRTRRLARQHLRQWLRSNPDGLPSDLTARLQQAFSQPDSANLLQLADAIQTKHPQLAASLRQFEHERFSSARTTEQTISALRKCLRNALMIAMLLCLSACSGANVSPKRELASRPTIISQPHHWQSVPSPVQSANNFARRRVSTPVRTFLVTIALTTRPSFSTPIICSFNSKSWPSVKRRAFRSSSNNSADFTCPGLPPIGLISALTLPSSGYVPRFVRPPVQTRISLLPQPPKTPRS